MLLEVVIGQKSDKCQLTGALLIPYSSSLKHKIVLNAVLSSQQHCIECDLNTDQVWVAVATDAAWVQVNREVSEVSWWSPQGMYIFMGLGMAGSAVFGLFCRRLGRFSSLG